MNNYLFKIMKNNFNIRIMQEIKKRGRKPKLTSDKIDNISNSNISDRINVENNKYIYIDDDDIVNNNDDKLEESHLWLDKYKPKYISEIIGHKDEINILKEWLINFESSKYNSVIISSKHGIGKTIIIELLLKELNYNIKYVNINLLKNKNIISELINTCYIKKLTIKNKFLNKKDESIQVLSDVGKLKTNIVNNSVNNIVDIRYAIVINDTENLTLSSEKENIIKLLKLNTKKIFPIIFISNLQHSKLINSLKKVSLNIILNKPKIDDMKILIKRICDNENLKIENKLYNNIITYCQFDIRRLIVILQDLFNTYGSNIITEEIFLNFIALSDKKNIGIELYTLTRELLNRYKNINHCLELYESEKVLLPLTIYENYYKKIFKQKIDNKKLLSIIADISNSISIGNEIETNIYSEQNWYLQIIHGFYTCVTTSYIINSIDNNINIPVSYDLIFSADLNKTSTKNINKKKNIFTLQNKFNNNCINDILYINKIFYELIKLKKNKILKDIKKSYNLIDKNILVALKIDKTIKN